MALSDQVRTLFGLSKDYAGHLSVHVKNGDCIVLQDTAHEVPSYDVGKLVEWYLKNRRFAECVIQPHKKKPDMFFVKVTSRTS